MRSSPRSFIAVSVVIFLSVLCLTKVWAAGEEDAQKKNEQAKAKTAALMSKMDALGRSESFGSMADRTLMDLETAAKTPNSNQIIYLARRYERLLEAARFNIFLADRQNKDVTKAMDRVRALSKKGQTALKKIIPEVPSDAKSAIERAEATSMKSRSVLYQRLVDKKSGRVATAASVPKVPKVPSVLTTTIPVSAKKRPTVPKPPTIPSPPKVPPAPPQLPEREEEEATMPPASLLPTAPESGAVVVEEETEEVSVETTEKASPPTETKKPFWKRLLGE